MNEKKIEILRIAITVNEAKKKEDCYNKNIFKGNFSSPKCWSEVLGN